MTVTSLPSLTILDLLPIQPHNPGLTTQNLTSPTRSSCNQLNCLILVSTLVGMKFHLQCRPQFGGYYARA